MELGKITDDQITASSSFYDGHWLPRQARLNYNDNGWTPKEDSNREYIQVQVLELGLKRKRFLKLLLWLDQFREVIFIDVCFFYQIVEKMKNSKPHMQIS